MPKLNISGLNGLSLTGLMVLNLRARESMRTDAIIRDPQAIEMCDQIEFDFSVFDKAARRLQVYVAIRASIFDAAARSFLSEAPEAVIINLGAGLDTRCSRIKCERVTWFDVDLEEVMEIRGRFFPETDRHKILAHSAWDFNWMKRVPKNLPILTIAEGFLIYFDEEKVKDLLIALANNFPGSQVLVEGISPLVTKLRLSGVDKKSAPLKWGVSDFRSVEAWHPAIRLKRLWHAGDFHRRRWSHLTKVIAAIPRLNRAFKIALLDIAPTEHQVFI